MNLFDTLVKQAIENQPQLSTLKMVVEKELLHHDILKILSKNNLLKNLTFIGGTALRLCYKGIRLSEDLDFTGGKNFSYTDLSQMAKLLENSLYEKYGLNAYVSNPSKEDSQVKTWKIKVQTRSQQKHLPSQKIHIDICELPSYDKAPMMLINPYKIDMGTNGLIIQTQTCEEIYTDKLIECAFRPNRIKYRDLWDIVWLNQQSIEPNFELIIMKLQDRELSYQEFSDNFCKRATMLNQDNKLEIEFQKEMQRFLPLNQFNEIIKQDNFWQYTSSLINHFAKKIKLQH